MKRVASQYFPDTVCGVVQDCTDEVMHRCQFSWFCDGKPDEIDDAASWAEATELASQVYWGRAEDPSGGALWYHADYVKPGWRKAFAEAAVIGRHIFYNRKPRSEEHTSELQSLMRISYAVFCLKKNK